ncbi:DUF1707 SHOCT-like domain-containing protein [Corynebacterium halotolerans]|uniref:DUF1707 domain-containing protein n=1 Tax=Corynebacterium halotolerans YIM 70093 = DSM 44683 TaxID=1121362 RepID=M1NWI1_9CORY|nr:DUF1707 domain-containing protein [Corynebacterium halotolerans]AGF71850.1 hypothetical protein A605_04195 [Corynebacterium halotolerans YIM 70093 = DSM 44683]
MDDHLRLSDSDRIHALQALSTHYTDGRLDDGEFDERTRAATTARTVGELRPLFSDLPGGLPFRADPEGFQALLPVTPQEPGRAVSAHDAELREMQQIRNRGRKVENMDGAIFGVTLLVFLILQFAVGVNWAWMVWPSLVVTMSLPRLIYRFSDSDQKTYAELKEIEEKNRKARVEHAAKRMRELEDGS